jgi:hypothetical protein
MVHLGEICQDFELPPEYSVTLSVHVDPLIPVPIDSPASPGLTVQGGSIVKHSCMVSGVVLIYEGHRDYG